VYRTASGIVHVEAVAEPAARGTAIGIVVADPVDALEYISALPGGLPTDYYVIRDVADVPEKLGGIASLTAEWPPGLADALARACGLT
jgi:hypothetical protein